MAADLLGAREIVNYVSLDNTPSVRVQESLGFVLSGTEEYPGCPAGAVSYTHLDVYKRQV